jgi:hypothetical protein
MLPMKSIKVSLLFSLFCLAPCNTTSAQSSSFSNKDFLVIQENEPLPEGLVHVGRVKIGDDLRVNCGYEKTIAQATEFAETKGANVMKITELRHPGLASSCYRVDGELYYTDDIQKYISKPTAKADSIIASLIPDTASYALLYFYRLRNFNGMAVEYVLHVEDSMVYKMQNGNYAVVKVQNKGETTIWARTEKKTKLELNIEHGKVYFVNCSVGMGVLMGHPKLELVETQRGLEEFEMCREERAIRSVPRSKRKWEDDIYR